MNNNDKIISVISIKLIQHDIINSFTEQNIDFSSMFIKYQNYSFSAAESRIILLAASLESNKAMTRLSKS